MLLISDNSVFVTSADVALFKASWPCSGLPDDVCIDFYFDSNGLCDIRWYDSELGIDIAEPVGMNDSALLALSHDAQEFLNLGVA
jgi:hypothetical protein